MTPDRGAIHHSVLLTLLLTCGVAAQDSSISSREVARDPVVPAVVQILAIGPSGMGQNQECSATGFVVNEEGYILTNAHVVEKARECLAHSTEAKILAKPGFSEGLHNKAPENYGIASAGDSAKAVECEVIAEDSIHDLAVLKALHPLGAVGKNGTAPFVRLSTVAAPIGMRVNVTGHPAFAFAANTESAEIVGRKSLTLDENSSEQTEVLVLDTPLKHGNSGSPVYLIESGAVVGIVERRNTANNQEAFAVPVRYAVDFLNRLAVKWHVAPE